MGCRANFVVVRDGQAEAYYDQWAALGCIGSFAAGPDGACEALAEYEATNELMDWAFAEGGYLIDFDVKVAIVFGHTIELDELEEAGVEIDERFREANAPFEEGGLAYLRHIGPNWIGWRLVWDDRGVDAFAVHLKRRSITRIAVQPASHPRDTSEAIEYRA